MANAAALRTTCNLVPADRPKPARGRESLAVFPHMERFHGICCLCFHPTHVASHMDTIRVEKSDLISEWGISHSARLHSSLPFSQPPISTLIFWDPCQRGQTSTQQVDTIVRALSQSVCHLFLNEDTDPARFLTSIVEIGLAVWPIIY